MGSWSSPVALLPVNLIAFRISGSVMTGGGGVKFMVPVGLLG